MDIEIVIFTEYIIELFKENIIQANIFYLVLGYTRYYFVLLHE